MPPADEFQNGLRFLQKMAGAQPRNLEEARIVAYAIYTLTREQVITTNYILNLEDYLDKTQANQWHDDLAGVYLAGSLALLKKDKEAQKLIDGYHMGDPNRRGGWCDFLRCARGGFAICRSRLAPFPGDAQADHAAAIPCGHRADCRWRFLHALGGLCGDGAEKLLAAHGGEPRPSSRSPRSGKTTARLRFRSWGNSCGTPISRRRPPRSVSPRRRRSAGMGAFYQVVQTGYHTALPTKPEADGPGGVARYSWMTRATKRTPRCSASREGAAHDPQPRQRTGHECRHRRFAAGRGSRWWGRR